MGKIIIAGLVLVVVIVLGWMWYANSSSAPAATNVEEITPNTRTIATTTNTTKIDNGMITSPSDSSDAALQSDLDSTDTQINNLNVDNTNL